MSIPREHLVYSVSEAGNKAGVDGARISQWLFAELFQPEKYKPRGSGDRSVLGERNIQEIRLINRLLSFGMKRATVKSVVDMLNSSKISWWGKGWLVVSDDTWSVTDNPYSTESIKTWLQRPVTIIVKI